TRGSTFDTLLAVYTGSNVSNLTLIASDEDRGGFFTSELHFNAVAGTEYEIAIDGFAGAEGDFILEWALEITNETIPIVTRQPPSQTVTNVGIAKFTVQAIGAA